MKYGSEFFVNTFPHPEIKFLLRYIFDDTKILQFNIKLMQSLQRGKK